MISASDSKSEKKRYWNLKVRRRQVLFKSANAERMVMEWALSRPEKY